MRWFLNDSSLQAQFAEPSEFVVILRAILALRQQFDILRTSLYVTRSFSQRHVRDGLSLVELLRRPEHREIQALVLRWLGREGPFVDDDLSPETDDYFEFKGEDVTNTGLGEATRRVKARQVATTFSFSGGALNFAESSLTVDHGLPDNPLGQYEVPNLYSIDNLRTSVDAVAPPPRQLARTRGDGSSSLP